MRSASVRLEDRAAVQWVTEADGWVYVTAPSQSPVASLSHPARVTAVGGDGAGSWSLVLVVKGWVQGLVSTRRPGSCSLLCVSGELDLAFFGGWEGGIDVFVFVVGQKVLGTLHNFLLSLCWLCSLWLWYWGSLSKLLIIVVIIEIGSHFRDF